jgi:hypothetical protein
MKREPIRPVELRKDYCGGMKFDENFDWDNLFYDAVQLDANTMVLIGPPLYQTANMMAADWKFSDGANNLGFSITGMDRTCITVVNTNTWVKELTLTHAEPITIPVNVIDPKLNGLKCLFTLQKDNPIPWIKQWIQYHHVNFGVDGVLIYDNNSQSYSVEELEDQLQVPGVTVKVVAWDVPYGPQGYACDYYNTWDSDYAQSSMFEHAKRRYLSKALIAINADIDELLVIEGASLDMAINAISSQGLAGLCYKGRWIEPYDIDTGTPANQIPLEDRQFTDYHCIDQRNPIDIGNKWMVIPDKAMTCQWSVHNTSAKMPQTIDIYYGHYMAMNTNWSWSRDSYDRDTTGLTVDAGLMHNLSKIRTTK